MRTHDDTDRVIHTQAIHVLTPQQVAITPDGHVVLLETDERGDVYETRIVCTTTQAAAELVQAGIHAWGVLWRHQFSPDTDLIVGGKA